MPHTPPDGSSGGSGRRRSSKARTRRIGVPLFINDLFGLTGCFPLSPKSVKSAIPPCRSSKSYPEVLASSSQVLNGAVRMLKRFAPILACITFFVELSGPAAAQDKAAVPTPTAGRPAPSAPLELADFEQLALPNNPTPAQTAPHLPPPRCP